MTPAFNYSAKTLWAWKLESKIVAKWIPILIHEVLLPQTIDLIGLQSWLIDISLLFITISCYFYFQKIDSYKVVDRLTQEYGHWEFKLRRLYFIDIGVTLPCTWPMRNWLIFGCLIWLRTTFSIYYFLNIQWSLRIVYSVAKCDMNYNININNNAYCFHCYKKTYKYMYFSLLLSYHYHDQWY